MTAPLEVSFESTRRVSQAEFAAWVRAHEGWGDINRYELLDGRIIMNPPAGYPHGSIESNLHLVIANFVRAHRLGFVFGSSQGFELPSGDTLEPDVSFVSRERWNAAPPPEDGKFLVVVPDLVVEVLSSGTAKRDRGEKRKAYERAGVREYWLADRKSRSIVQIVRKGKRLMADRICKKRLLSHVLAGLEVDVPDIFP